MLLLERLHPGGFSLFGNAVTFGNEDADATDIPGGRRPAGLLA